MLDPKQDKVGVNYTFNHEMYWMDRTQVVFRHDIGLVHWLYKYVYNPDALQITPSSICEKVCIFLVFNINVCNT